MPRRTASNGTRSSHRIITYALLAPFFLFWRPACVSNRRCAQRIPSAAGARRRMH
ncbi:hypothetical protein BURMUCGD2M_4936 [Burkholderia multivorans CGD2M]|uniref:Uncharacterized protein n=1 Tax=Burkholderia multivorans CGD2 TaxID=513052 RepID=B9BIN7_9BURK|nr:hypothetical protein BURMUCGD2_4943 [Burkholderia multivorans CGD2]EEE15493.1 hypothetical protein BURMUCGD2M_4936 [Burkholderia multivorans CGD2M]